MCNVCVCAFVPGCNIMEMSCACAILSQQSLLLDVSNILSFLVSILVRFLFCHPVLVYNFYLTCAALLHTGFDPRGIYYCKPWIWLGMGRERGID